MKLSLFSNFINHHQIPLSDNFFIKLRDEYCFIATEPTAQEQLNLGYADQNKSVPYVLTTYDNQENLQQARALVTESEVVIVGSAPDSIMVKRLPAGKLTFHSSERYFKAGHGIRQLPRNFASAMRHIRRFQKYPNYYYLCMSAYTAADVNTFANYTGRMFKWGYFTELKYYDINRLLEQKADRNSPVRLLWVARLIDLKHPEAAVAAAEALRNRGCSFHLDLIGIGCRQEQTEQRIRAAGLSDCVSLLGSMPPEKVREHMEAADIFLFTSDFNEGWGAVLNEAMNSGCAVVASHAIGSVPYLLRDGENGLIYENGNQQQLNQKVQWLAEHPEERRRLGRAAYETMVNEWNAEVAAERFLKLVHHIQSGLPGSPYPSGPCSEAEILRNDWYPVKNN